MQELVLAPQLSLSLSKPPRFTKPLLLLLLRTPLFDALPASSGKSTSSLVDLTMSDSGDDPALTLTLLRPSEYCNTGTDATTARHVIRAEQVLFERRPRVGMQSTFHPAHALPADFEFADCLAGTG